jgi:transposase-like protein
MTIQDSERSIPHLVYCPTCKRRPMEIKKVGLGQRTGQSVVQYVCSKCGETRTESSRKGSKA